MREYLSSQFYFKVLLGQLTSDGVRREDGHSGFDGIRKHICFGKLQTTINQV